MRLRAVIAFAAAATVGLWAFAAAAQTRDADQAPNKRTYRVVSRDYTVSRSRDEDGRRRTRIIVQKRSYLDPGTEVLQGERNYTDYAVLPTQSPIGVLEGTAFGSRGTLPGPFDLPGKRNIWGW